MMWEMNNLWAQSKSTSMGSYLTVMNEIHVLLVDHDPEGLMHMAHLLELCQYRVTLVEFAAAATSMLASGKVKFDLVMANINSPDLHGFKLVQQAVNMDLPVILLSVDDNSFMAMRAIESGACLYIKKPVSMEFLRCLWQHVAVRDKAAGVTRSERDRFMPINYNTVRGLEFRNVENSPPDIGAGNNIMPMSNDEGKAKKKASANGTASYTEYNSQNQTWNNNRIKRKVCTEWTQELHDKFMDAVEQLGEGRCFPKEILELMNVPGLTRMQVASHLQKCRNDNWRTPEERRGNQTTQTAFPDNNDWAQRLRRFGSMPRLSKSGSHRTTSGTGGSSDQTQSESDLPNHGGIDSTRTGPVVVANPHQQQQNYGYSLVAYTNNTVTPGAAPPPSGTLPQNPTDYFFSFPEMDSLIQNYIGFSQGYGMLNQGSTAGGYQYDPFYHHQEAAQTVDVTSHLRSEASNFGSDESATRGN